MQIIAKDQDGKGLEGSAELHIQVKDINDNAPRFEKQEYVFWVSLQEQVGRTVGTVTAIDHDIDPQNRRVMYVLKAGGYGKFRVDFDSGLLFVHIYNLVWFGLFVFFCFF